MSDFTQKCPACEQPTLSIYRDSDMDGNLRLSCACNNCTFSDSEG